MDPDDPRIPESLRTDLNRLYARRPAASPEVDEAILSRARAHLARRNRFSLLLRLGGAAAAVAAIVLVSVVMLHRPHRPQVAITGDTNHDGVVDIRDALTLARKLDAHDTKWTGVDDANGDTVVDRRDVDAIAMLAVKLDDGSRGATR